MTSSLALRYFLALTLLAFGSILVYTSTMQAADVWPAGEGGVLENKLCYAQSGSCFGNECSSCSLGPDFWRTCGSVVWLYCKEIQTRSYGSCSGTNANQITCYTKFYCAQVGVYEFAGCGTQKCKWWVKFGPDACDPNNP